MLPAILYGNFQGSYQQNVLLKKTTYVTEVKERFRIVDTRFSNLRDRLLLSIYGIFSKE